MTFLKQIVSTIFLFAGVLAMAQCPTTSVGGDITISSNCTISTNLTIGGNLTISNSSTLTIDPGVVVTVDGVLQTAYQGGAITVNGGGTINVGGRFYNNTRTITSFTFSNVTVTVNNTSSATVVNDYQSTLNLTNGTSFTVVQGDFHNEDQTTLNVDNSTVTLTSGDFLNDDHADIYLSNESQLNLNNGDMNTEDQSIFQIDDSDVYINGAMNNDYFAQLTVQNGGTLTITGDFNNGINPIGDEVTAGFVDVDGGSISVGGDLVNDYGSDITVDGGGSLAVTGDVTNDQDATINVPDGTFSYGGTLTDPFGGVTSSSSDSDCDDGCCGSGCTALPVTLMSFEGHEIVTGVELNWTTVSEITNDFFTLEKSSDGLEFVEIARVSGAGDSYDQLDYQYIDYSLSNGLTYYRLSQTDFDGAFEYLKVISVGNSGKLSQLSVSPNPVYADSKNVQVHGISAEMTWTLFSINGSVQNSGSFIENSQISVEGLQKGVYLIRVSDDVNTRVTKILIK